MNSSHSALGAPTNRRPFFLVISILCFLICATGIIVDPVAGWSGSLIAGFFGLTLVLGASTFSAINAITGARWCSPINMVPPTVAHSYLVPVVVIALTIFLGHQVLYPWTNHAAVEHNHLLHAKAGWLNTPFFLTRALVVLLVFIGLITRLFPRHKSQADKQALPSASFSALYIIIFALAISVAGWDWIMSLEPEWFSTMFGVYCFAGVIQGGVAVVTVAALFLSSSKNPLVRLGDQQMKDLGGLLCGFSMFWGYIWFCQYMLIWYSNMPEETGYYIHRMNHGWGMIFWLNPIVNFIILFFPLLSKSVRTQRLLLLQLALVAIVGRWLDTYLMIAPASGEEPGFPIYALAATALLLGGMLLLSRKYLSSFCKNDAQSTQEN